MDPVALVTAVKEFGLLICAGIGAGVALKGLETWRKQLHGQSDYDLAKRMALALYKWREAVRAVRVPFVWAEATMPIQPGDSETSKTVRVYEKRWNAQAAAAAELDALALEGEALWGPPVHLAFGPVRDVQHRLRVGVMNYLEQDESSRSGVPIPEGPLREAWIAAREAAEKIVFARAEADTFWRDVVAAVGGVEKILRPYLGRP